MLEDQPPTYHPPPYGTDTHDEAAASPSYEMNDLGSPPPPSPHPLLSHPTSSSASIPSALTLDEATIEGCAPKKAARKPFVPPWLFHSRKGHALVGVILLLFAGLVGAMIWYGVHRAKVKKDREEAAVVRRARATVYLDAARSTVLPEVPPGLVSFDYELITPFNFSAPLPSQILYNNNAGTPTNFSIFTSTLQQPFRLVPTSYNYVKIFGSRSSKVSFVSATADSPPTQDILVNVTAIWKAGEGWTEEESTAWGLKELGQVSGGLHGSNWTGIGSGGVRGVGLITSSSEIGDGSYQPSDLAKATDFLPNWNQTLVFNITVTVPRSFQGGSLEVFGESAMAVSFDDFTQTNTTFFDVDVRAPKGSISSYGGFNTTESLSLFSLLPIFGRFTVSSSLTFISNSTIKTELVVLPLTNHTFRQPDPSTHNLTFLQLNPLSSSLLQTNITSFPAHANLTLTALNLNGSVGLAIPHDVYEGSVMEGTNNGRTVGFALSWANSSQYPRSPDWQDFVPDKDLDGWDSGFSWSGADVLWKGEGGTSVGVGKGEIALMTEEGVAFFGASTGFWVNGDGSEEGASLFP